MSAPSAIINNSEAHVAFLAVRLISIAEVMRLLPLSEQPAVDTGAIRNALQAFSREGIARHAASLGNHLSTHQLADVLADVLSAIEESPVPRHEWPSMTELLGDDLLEKLLGVSGSSMHRYRGGARATPDHIAGRLHVVTLIVADLAGSYNDFGIRRWFGRSRTALADHSPLEVLRGDWSPNSEGAQQVRALAASLLAPLAA